MRAALWFLALFGVAVAIALFAGNNQAVVTVFWPPHRIDISFNLMVLLQITDEKRGLVFVMIAADVAMIVFGFFGERYSRIPGMEFESWVMFGLGCMAFLILLYMMYSVLADAAKDKVAPVKKAFLNMRTFIVVGWMIYPVGFIIGMLAPGDGAKIARELVYNFADLINKPGLGLIALIAARQISRDAGIRQAMRSL